MKRITLCQQAAKNFRQLVAGLDEANPMKRIDNRPGTYMAVVVEFLGKVVADGRTYSNYSIGHYYQQEGDRMSDPDITFLAVDGCEAVYPASFRQDGGFPINRTYMRVNDKQQMTVPAPGSRGEAMMADAACFCTKWFRNIKDQQGI
jgi:hypothetical protein